ncbi:MAG: recombinase family protein [Oscillospiraceae bacterium]|nr:recombinase family protein [Oscillospiraceae bacterium]
MLKTIKVAVYCRVSTDKEDQANSFESQQRFFREYIERQPDWELHDIYADEGITGTSTKKRAAFNRMIADAKLGRFDRIITKEVSRFSRNILDTLSFTRELRAAGIAVIFMNDGINTLDSDAELRLTIMGSIAQEESRRTSSRVKWGQTRRMEQGVVFGRSMLGYHVKDGKMTIEPVGAEIVRLIYQKYVTEHKGTSVIARELREAGYKTLTGNAKWTNTVILKILRNEKYCGDLCQKKTYTPDYLTHDKKYNHGAEEKVFIEDHHQPIVDRELRDAAQREMARRNVKSPAKGGHGNRYPLSGKIKCGDCGVSFSARYKTLKSGNKRKVWRCFTATAHGKKKLDAAENEVGCDIGRQLRDEVAMDILKQSMDGLLVDRAAVTATITKIVTEVIRDSESGEQVNIDKLEKQLALAADKKKSALDCFLAGHITKREMRMMNDTYDAEIAGLAEKLSAARKRQQICYQPKDIKKHIKAQVDSIINGRMDSELFYGSLLSQITVHSNDTVDVSLNLLPTKWIYVIESLRATR